MLVVCGVIEGGVEGVEVAVLYQQNMKNNIKRNTHNDQRKAKGGGGEGAQRYCHQQEEGL